jgi:hypothetical protein
MKRITAGLLTAMILALCFGAGAEGITVRLPDSAYSVTVPEGMIYDGPGEGADTSQFAWVDEKIGLDIIFFCYDNAGVDLWTAAEKIRDLCENVGIYLISGIEMLVYELTDPGDPPGEGMRCIAYTFQEGNLMQEICFWYATQEAADRTAEIIESITKKE